MRQIKFKNFVTLQRGFDLPKNDMLEGTIPVVGSTSIIGHHNEHKVKPPGVITGRSGSLGQVQYIAEKYWPHNTALWVKDFQGNHPKYVFYFLKTLNLARFNAGAGVPTLNRNHLDELDVYIHELREQRRIADILSVYDNLIENNTRRIRILGNMARAIYREWFGKVSPESMLDGWKMVKLGDVIELVYGKGLKADQRINGQYPVYSSAGIVGYHNEFIVKSPGIIVGRKGNVGSVFWADEDFFVIDTAYFVQTQISLYYVFFNLQTQNFINNDAAVPGLSRNQAYSLPFLMPPKDILNRFDEFVGPVFQQLNTLTKKNTNLSQTRDLLLPRLVSGEIDISNLSN